MWTAALLCCTILAALPTPGRSQTCSSYSFSSNAKFTSCVDLPVLNSYLHWNYDQTTNTASIAFRRSGASASEWISWAINPSKPQMAGSQALVAYQNPSTGSMYAYTSPIASTDTTLPEGNLSFGVPSLNASFQNGEMTIFATLQLTAGSANGINQVWQVGPMSGGSPSIHPLGGANGRSTGTLSFVSGTTTVSGNSKQRNKNVHGVLNAISWGTLMPLGAIVARYLKVFKSADPAWFYLHVTCQTTAYVVGVAGWITGMKLGADAAEVHGNIGATLFALGTLQVFALLLRPKKDHKYRTYWNIYHYAIGYTVIVLSVVNVFKGLDLLNPGGNWKTAYVGILIFLGGMAGALEAITWYIVLKRRKSEKEGGRYPGEVNGNHHYHGGQNGIV
ncbi:hypothetical protein MLD38_009089 [Melastoma candidum]|uniref:Uncharacterized protein n=1 Tax=Melastoma candidum TaxID=119954 RepID=A0ACB9S0S5_9MYRT|nr:hypothetical protein MLD38_009089 [Melastoma candidum]